MRFWDSGNPTYQNGTPCFSFYNLSMSNISGNSDINGSGLAFGYFISNLLEVVYRNVLPNALTHQYFEFLYPLEGTKEMYRIDGREIYLQI